MATAAIAAAGRDASDDAADDVLEDARTSEATQGSLASQVPEAAGYSIAIAGLGPKLESDGDTVTGEAALSLLHTSSDVLRTNIVCPLTGSTG